MSHLTTELGVTLLVLIGIIGFVLLARHRAEAHWRASESRWESLVTHVKDLAIFMIDSDGRVASWNEGAAAIKGYRPEEIIGRPIAIFYTPEDIRQGVPAYNLRMAEQNGSHHSEGWRMRKDGSRFWAEIVFTALYDEHHRVKAFLKITRDTTEKKLSQEKIANLARLIEDTGDAVISTDQEFTIRSWNRGAELLYGFPAAEVEGLPFSEVLRTPEGGLDRESIRKKLAEEGSWAGERSYFNKRGLALASFISVSETRDAAGERDGFVMICRDMTEWKKVEERLRQFNKELELQVEEKTAAMARSKDEFRALASRLQDIREEERASMAREIHDELGQQLTGLKMDLAFIAKKNRGANGEGLADDLAATMRVLDSTMATIRRLGSELRPGILDDLGLVAAIEWQSQEFERRSGIRTVFHTGLGTLELPPSVAIPLFRICQESLTNVARHSGAGRVEILLDEQDGELVLRIQDDGRGIDLPIGEIGRGKTLGLLGMKERAFIMGGTLEIVSRPGEGLSLTVRLPLKPLI